MPPIHDPRIPPLVTLTEAATILGTTKQWVSKLRNRGTLSGQYVGTVLVLPAETIQALARVRAEGHSGWDHELPRPELPKLFSSGQAAEQLGYAHHNRVHNWFQQGRLPGQLVSDRTLVFAADTVHEKALEREPRGRV